MDGMYDAIVVGAGISGITAAYHLQQSRPGKSFLILEARASMGGTWDLFKYPGIRSDSDMYTFGFSFNLWKEPRSFADGPTILKYVKETAAKFGLDKKIRYNAKVTAAAWSQDGKCWTLQVSDPTTGAAAPLRCRFLFMCSGYYDYERGHDPVLPGSESFQGRIVHAQGWQESIDYERKRVVVIGSGATAVTLVPALAKKAAQVTMLQRSPTYVYSLPATDSAAKVLHALLPRQLACLAARWKNILFCIVSFNAARRWPNATRRLIRWLNRRQLGNSFDMRHFEPAYKPWEQRLCFVPDHDLFRVIREGRAEVVTDTIDRVTETGLRLASGRELAADIIVKATGLKLQMLGGMKPLVDGRAIDPAEVHCYRGVMMSGLPNFAFAVGYTNASWTLKCDLSARYVARLLNHMDERGYSTVTPRFNSERFGTEPLLDFESGYIKRASHLLPKQGSAAPWKVYQNYIRDLLSLKFGAIDDGYLIYQ